MPLKELLSRQRWRVVWAVVSLLAFVQTVILAAQGGDRPPRSGEAVPKSETDEYEWGLSFIPVWLVVVASGAGLVFAGLRAMRGPGSLLEKARSHALLGVVAVDWVMAVVTAAVLATKLNGGGQSWMEVGAAQVVACLLSTAVCALDAKGLIWCIALHVYWFVQVPLVATRADRDNSFSFGAVLTPTWMLLAICWALLGVVLVLARKKALQRGGGGDAEAAAGGAAVVAAGEAYKVLGALAGLLGVSLFLVMMFLVLLTGWLDRAFAVAGAGAVVVPLCLWELGMCGAAVALIVEDMAAEKRDRDGLGGQMWGLFWAAWHGLPVVGGWWCVGVGGSTLAVGEGADADTGEEGSDGSVHEGPGQQAHASVSGDSASSRLEDADLDAALDSIDQRMNNASKTSKGPGKGPGKSPGQASGTKHGLPDAELEQHPVLRQLMEEKQALQAELCAYKRAFLEEHGRPIESPEDREPVEAHYQEYQMKKAALETLTREYAKKQAGEDNEFDKLCAMLEDVDVGMTGEYYEDYDYTYCPSEP